jgi:Flp pilus assembly protein TadD
MTTDDRPVGKPAAKPGAGAAGGPAPDSAPTPSPAPSGLEALAAPVSDLPIPGPDEAKPMAAKGPGLETTPVVPAKIAPMGQPRPPTGAEQAAALHRAGRTDEAIQSYTTVLKEDPGDARAWANLGVALRTRGRLEAAAACYRRSLAIEPKSAAVLSNLGNVLRMLGRHEEATQCQRRALEADPSYLIAAYNMGLQLRDVGLYREAVGYFDRAIAGGYARPEVLLDRAYALLSLGNYVQGFAEYEWRLKLPSAPNPPSAAPEWDGGAVQGKSILVHVEPGPRDTVTFLRYLPLLGARGARVVVLAPASMAGLITALPGVAEVLTQGKPPATDLRAPLNSLPRLFGTTAETILAQTPYLRVPLGRPPRVWASAPEGVLKVGVSWAERVSDPDRAARACPFPQFLRLAGVGGAQLYRLQTGAAAAERDQHGAGALIRDLAGEFGDLADAAEAISQLDLVIGVDSPLVLLAGALGKPGYVALASNADWRWGAAGETSPWFPTLRLFRQRRPGDWEELFQRLTVALAARASGTAEPLPQGPRAAAASTAAAAKPQEPATGKSKRAAKRPGRKAVAAPAAEAKPVEPVPPSPPLQPKPLRIPGILPDKKLSAAAPAPVAPPPSPPKTWPEVDRRQTYASARPATGGPAGSERRASYAPVSAPAPPPQPPAKPAPEPPPVAKEGPPAEEPAPQAAPMPELPAAFAAALDALAAQDAPRAAVRRFLDRHLKPREAVIEVGVGNGLVSLAAAARHPGRVNAIALDPDGDRVHALVSAAEGAGVPLAIEALAVAAGARPTTGRTGVPATVTLDGLMADRPELGRRQVFLVLDAGGREPEIVAGALELFARSRVAAMLWRRSAVYDEPAGQKRFERLLEDLGGLGFRHFRIDPADPAAEPEAYDGKSPAALIASLPKSFAAR